MRPQFALIRAGERIAPRHFRLSDIDWRLLCDGAEGLPLLGLWCDDAYVFALFLDADKPLMASTALIDGRYDALSRGCATAAVHERIAQDLWGAEPMDARDVAVLLDTGGWRRSAPMAARSLPAAGPVASDDSAPFSLGPGGQFGGQLGAVGGGEPLMQMSARPYGAGLGGIAVRGGYAHRGVLSCLRGLAPDAAMAVAGRISGGGYVAYPLALARAIERAQGQAPSAALRRARAILLEVERIGVHLHDLARLAAMAQAPLIAAHAARAREAIAQICAGHDLPRRLTDLILPHGVRGAGALPALARAVAEAMTGPAVLLGGLLPGLEARLAGLGRVESGLVHRQLVGGIVGRASGRGFDLRRQEAAFDPRVLSPGRHTGGDAAARAALLLREIEGSAVLLAGMADGFDQGGSESGLSRADDAAAPEGIGAVEGARGDIWAWVRLHEGRLDQVWFRDPALPLLSSLPGLLRGGTPETIGIVLASLGWSMSGLEL